MTGFSQWAERQMEAHDDQGKPARHLNCLISVHRPRVLYTEIAARMGYHSKQKPSSTKHSPSLRIHKLACQSSKKGQLKAIQHIDYPTSAQEPSLQLGKPPYHHDKPGSSKTQSSKHRPRTASTRGHYSKKARDAAPSSPSAPPPPNQKLSH